MKGPALGRRIPTIAWSAIRCGPAANTLLWARRFAANASIATCRFRNPARLFHSPPGILCAPASARTRLPFTMKHQSGWNRAWPVNSFSHQGSFLRVSLRSCRINDRSHLSHRVGREAALIGMLQYGCLVRRNIDAVNLVVGHVTLHPLDLRTHALQHTA